MSLVRISKELINSVEGRVSAMANRELAQYPASFMELTPNDPDFAEYLEVALEVLWSKAPQLRGQLPAEWMDKTHYIDLHYKQPGAAVHIKLKAGAVTPPHTGSYPDVVVDYRHDKLEALTEKIRRGQVARSEILSKYTNIRVQLVKFLNAQPSLNRALVKHPEIVMYIADEYIARVNAKDTRSKTRRENEPSIDVDAITTAAVAHRLATAGGAA